MNTTNQPSSADTVQMALIQLGYKAEAAIRHTEATVAAASAFPRAQLANQIALAQPADKPALYAQLKTLNDHDHDYLTGFRAGAYGLAVPTTSSAATVQGQADGAAERNAPEVPTGVRADGSKK